MFYLLKPTTTSTELLTGTLLDRKIEETGAGLPLSYTNKLYVINQRNAATIIDYISAMRIEVNISDHYRKDLIEILCRVSRYCKDKLFKDVTRDNITTFLDSFRKTETSDPLHKWIGTYNIFRMHLMRFFKWLYYPHMS